MAKSMFLQLLAGEKVEGVPEEVAIAVSKQGLKVNDAAKKAILTYGVECAEKAREDFFNEPKEPQPEPKPEPKSD